MYQEELNKLIVKVAELSDENTKRGRASVGGLKASEYYGTLIDPKQLVDAIFITAGITHERACISPDCNIEVLFKFAELVDVTKELKIIE